MANSKNRTLSGTSRARPAMDMPAHCGITHSAGNDLITTRSGRAGAPALVVGLARGASRTGVAETLHAHLELLVALDGGLLGAAVLLAPHQRQHVADIDIRVDDAQRQPQRSL